MKDKATRLFLRHMRRTDGQAIGRLFDLVGPELLAVARHVAPDIASAEDLVQTTFMVALEGAHRFDKAREVRPWLFGVLMREAARARRDAARRRARGSLVEVENYAATAESVTSAELHEAVAQALAKLPERYRAVLHPHLVEGLTAPEIALRLSEAPSSGTVRVQIARGLERLRRLLPADLALAALAGGAIPRGHNAVREVVVASADSSSVQASAGSLASSAALGATTSLAVGGLAMLKVQLVGGGLVVAAVVAFLVSVGGPQTLEMPGVAATTAGSAEDDRLVEPIAQGGERLNIIDGADPMDGEGTSEGEAVTIAQDATIEASGQTLQQDGAVAPRAVIFDALELTPIAMAGEDGRFNLSRDGAPAFILASLAGHARSNVVAVPSEEAVELTLRGSEARIELRVVNDQGEPVVGAAVTVSEVNPRHLGTLKDSAGVGRDVYIAPEQRGRSGEDGTLVVAELLGAPHEIEVTAPGFVDLVTWTPPLVPGESTAFDVILRASATVFGRVTADGRGDAALVADSIWIVGTWGQRKSASTSVKADGTYELVGLQPGTVRLETRGTDWIVVEHSVELVAGEPTRWDPVLEPDTSSRIDGRLVDESGAPLASWYLAAHTNSLMSYASGCFTDENGAFILKSVLPDTRVLSAKPRSNYYAPDQGFAVFRGVHAGDSGLLLKVDGETLKSRLTVHGRIAYPNGSVPSPARVMFYSPLARTSMGVLVDEEGRFEIGSDDLGGEYELLAIGGSELGLLPVSMDIAVDAGERLDVGVIEVPRPGWLDLSLAVPDEPRRGTGELVLKVDSKAPSMRYQERITWDTPMPLALPPGIYLLALHATHYESAEVEFVVTSEGTTSVTLLATPTTKVELSFLGEDGHPPRGTVRLEIRHGASDVLLREESVAGVRSHQLDLEPLAGGYSIRAIAEDGCVGGIMGPLVGLREMVHSHVIRLVTPDQSR